MRKGKRSTETADDLALIVPNFQDKERSSKYRNKYNRYNRSKIYEAKVLFVAFDQKYQHQKTASTRGQKSVLTYRNRNEDKYFYSKNKQFDQSIREENVVSGSDSGYAVQAEQKSSTRLPGKKENYRGIEPIEDILKEIIDELSVRLDDPEIKKYPDILFLSELPAGYKQFPVSIELSGIEYQCLYNPEDPDQQIQRPEQKIIAYAKRSFCEDENRTVKAELMIRKVQVPITKEKKTTIELKDEHWVVVTIEASEANAYQPIDLGMKIAGVHLTATNIGLGSEKRWKEKIKEALAKGKKVEKDRKAIAKVGKTRKAIAKFMREQHIDAIIGDFNFPITGGEKGNRKRGAFHFLAKYDGADRGEIYAVNYMSNTNAADNKFYMGTYIHPHSEVTYRTNTENTTGVLSLDRRFKGTHFTDHNPFYAVFTKEEKYQKTAWRNYFKKLW